MKPDDLPYCPSAFADPLLAQVHNMVAKSANRTNDQPEEKGTGEFTADEKKALLQHGVKEDALDKINEIIKDDLYRVDVFDNRREHHPFAEAFKLSVKTKRVENFSELSLDKIKAIVDAETSKERVKIQIHTGYNVDAISTVKKYSVLDDLIPLNERRGIQTDAEGNESLLAKVTKRVSVIELHPIEYSRRLVQSSYESEVHWSFTGYIDYYSESGYYSSTTRNVWKIDVYSNYAIAELINDGTR